MKRAAPHEADGQDTLALLRTRGLCSGYGEVEIVRDIDIEVHAGEVVALLGANGAGKTTILNSLCGLLPRRMGSVELLGTELPTKPTRAALRRTIRNGVGIVPEQRCLFPSLTVDEHLVVAGSATMRAVVYEQLPALVPLRKRQAGLLSGGEQQMLTIARALVQRPKILLIDELSTGLAPIIVNQLLTQIRDLAANGMGILLVEQHVHAALQVADRAYVLRQGRIVLETDATALIRSPELLAQAYLTSDSAFAE